MRRYIWINITLIYQNIGTYDYCDIEQQVNSTSKMLKNKFEQYCYTVNIYNYFHSSGNTLENINFL